MDRPRFHRGGRATFRQALDLPTLLATRFDPDMKRTHRALVAAGKPAKVAITAIMRKTHRSRKRTPQGQPPELEPKSRLIKTDTLVARSCEVWGGACANSLRSSARNDPASNRLVRDRNPAFRQQILDVSELKVNRTDSQIDW